MAGGAELPAWCVPVLAGVGLEQPNPGDPLHVRLVNAVLRVGPAGQLGAHLSAMRFEFAWELRKAGEEYALAKARHERAMARRVVEEMHRARPEGGPRMTLGLATSIAEDATYDDRLAYLVAEQRERAMRKFLDAIEGALDNHRTDRADARRADAAHAQGLGGGA